jgi:hypothetical protein
MILLYYSTDFANGFYRGITGQEYESSYEKNGESEQLLNYPDFIPLNGFTLIGYLGFLIYALAKDKIFDEYMIQRRLESVYLVFFGTLCFLIFMILMNWDFSVIHLFEIQMVFYLILNKARRSI